MDESQGQDRRADRPAAPTPSRSRTPRMRRAMGRSPRSGDGTSTARTPTVARLEAEGRRRAVGQWRRRSSVPLRAPWATRSLSICTARPGEEGDLRTRESHVLLYEMGRPWRRSPASCRRTIASPGRRLLDPAAVDAGRVVRRRQLSWPRHRRPGGGETPTTWGGGTVYDRPHLERLLAGRPGRTALAGALRTGAADLQNAAVALGTTGGNAAPPAGPSIR